MSQHFLFTRKPWIQTAGNRATITAVPAPELPLAEVKEAEYTPFELVEWSSVYEILQWSSLERIRSTSDGNYPWTVGIQEWKVAVLWENIVAGAFVLDMSSIRLKWGDPTVLENVISTSNLDVSSFPEASFILQESSSDTIRGILTIKWVSKEITFPALIRVDDEKLRIFTEFSIEREHRWLGITAPEVTPYIDLSLERILEKNN